MNYKILDSLKIVISAFFVFQGLIGYAQPTVTATGGTTSFTEDGGAVLIDGGITITGGDGAISAAEISITAGFLDSEDELLFTDGNFGGTANITGSYDSGTGILSLSGGDGDDAQYQAALRSIQYNNTNTAAPDVTTRTISFTVTDGSGTSPATTRDVSITPENDAPTLTGSVTLAAIDEDETMNSGTLIATIITDFAGDYGDPDGTATTGLAVTGIDETDGSWEYTIDGSMWNSLAGVSTGSAVLLANDGDNAVRFVPDANYNGGSGNITFVAWDQSDANPDGSTGIDVSTGGGTTAYSTGSGTGSLTVNALNDFPVVNNLDGTSANTYIEGNPAVIIDADVTLTDVELGAAADYEGATLTLVRNGGVNSDDVFGFNDNGVYSLNGSSIEKSGTAIADFDITTLSGELTLTFSSINPISQADVDVVLQNITYSNGNLSPPSSVIIDYTPNDGTSDGTTESISINITASNDIPVISNLDANAASSFTEDGTAIDIDTDVTLSDTELDALNSGNGDYDGAIITVVRSGGTNSDDVFGFNGNATYVLNSDNIEKSGDIIASYDQSTPGTLVISFTNATTIPTTADATEVLQRITYSNSSDAPPSSVDLDYTPNDGTDDGTTETITINITGENDAPELDNSGTPTFSAIDEDFPDGSNTGDAVADFVIDGSITDPDGGAIEAIAVIGVDESDGDWQYSTDGGSSWTDFSGVDASNAILLDGSLIGGSENRVRFLPATNFNGTATIDYVAWDTSDSGTPGTSADASSGGGTSAFSTVSETATITINAVIDAPSYDNSGSPTFTTIDEDEPDGTNAGDGVASIVIGAITDVDGAGDEAIAVISVDNTNGNWQYSLNNGTTWIDFSGTSGVVDLSASARLLDGSLGGASTNLIRFEPNPDYNGSSSITYVIWDKSSGSVGDILDASITGGSTPFSAETEDVTITIDPVNDEPSFTTTGNETRNSSEGAVSIPGFVNSVDFGATNESSQSVLGYTLVTNSNSSIFSVNPAISNGGELTFTTQTNAQGSSTIGFELQDDGGTGNGGDDTSSEVQFTITINDDEGPVLNTASFDPADASTGITISDARTIEFSFNENVTAIGGNNISIYKSPDTSTPIEEADITISDVLVSGSDITWNLNTLLEKSSTYIISIDAGAFEDQSPATNNFAGLPPSGEDIWTFQTTAEAAPRFVFSPQDGQSGVAPSGVISFIFDEEVRAQNSANVDFDVDEIDGFSGSKLNDVENFNMRDGDPSISPAFPGFDSEQQFDVTASGLGSFNESSFYRITIGSSAFEDSEDNDSDQIIIEFETSADGTPPTISGAFDPVNGDATVAENRNFITATFNETVEAGTGNIQLYADLSTDLLVLDIPADDPLVDYSTPNEVTIDISGVNLSGGITYYVVFESGSVTDATGNNFAGFGQGTWEFTIDASTDNTPPAISERSPQDNEANVAIDATIDIEFSEPIFAQTGKAIQLRYSDSDILVEEFQANGLTINGNAFTLDPASDLSGQTNYYINIDNDAFRDQAGNSYSGIAGKIQYNFTTTTESTNPSVVSFSPDGAGPFAIDSDLVLTMSEPVGPISGNQISVIDDDNGDVVIATIDIGDPSVSVNGPEVTISGVNLEPSTTYWVEIEAGALEDASGNLAGAIGGNNQWEFETEADVTAPTVTLLSPLNDATGISTSLADLQITFSEPVNIGTGSADLLYNDGTSTGISFTTAALSGGNTVATFTLPEDLDGDTEYFISVDNTIFEDDAGNTFAGIAGNGSWSFVTTSESVLPALDGVSVNYTADDLIPDIVLDFSERVFAGSGGFSFVSTEQTLTIDANDGSQVTGIGTDQVTVTPNLELFNSTDYDFQVDTDALHDASDNFYSPTNPVTSFTSNASTVVNPATLIVCTNQDFVDFTEISETITIDETNDDDFREGTDQTLIVNLPSGFEFDFSGAAISAANATGSGTGLTVNDFGTGNSTITQNSFTVEYTTSSGSESANNQISISGLKVRYVGGVSGVNASATRSGSGNADMEGNQTYHGQNFINFTTQDPPAALTVGTDIDEAFVNVSSGDVEDDDLAMYRFRQIENNEASINVVTITPVASNYAVRIYTDEAETAEIGASPLNGSASHTLTISDFGLTDTDYGIHTFYITQTDPQGCESTATEYSIAIINAANSEGTLVYSESDTEGTTITVSHPNGHDLVFSGDGITNITTPPPPTEGSTKSFDFIPSTAGAGNPKTVLLNLTNRNSNVSAPYQINFVVNAVNNLIDVTNFCFENVENSIIVNSATAGVDFAGDTDDGDPDFYDIRIVRISDNTDITNDVILKDGGVPTPTVNVPYETTGWTFNPVPGDNDALLGPVDDNIEVRLILRVTDEGTGAITSYAADNIRLFKIPEVELANVNEFYCEDDGAFNIRATITVGTTAPETGVITNGYEIASSSDGINYGTPVSVGSAQLDPSALGTGYYRISYTTEGETVANCTNTTTFDFQVLSKPTVATLTNASGSFDGIGGQDGDGNYLLEYCDGDEISNLIASGDSITWYNNNFNVLPSVNGELDLEDVLGSSFATGGSQVRLFFSNKTDSDINGSGFEGCESDFVEVVIRAYDIPEAPEINDDGVNVFDLGNNTYSIEYCFGDAIQPVSVNEFLNSPRSHFWWVDQSISEVIYDSQDINVDLISELGLPNVAGLDTTIYLYQIENDSVFAAGEDYTTSTLFRGCQSSATTLNINIYDIPEAPDTTQFTQGRTDYYLCSGDDLFSIETPREDGAVYRWFTGDANGASTNQIDVGAFNDQFITQSELIAEGFSNVNTTSDPITYYYYLTQTTDVNSESGFIGCTSDTSQVSVTVYPDPDGPVFSDNNSNSLEIAYCAGEIPSDDLFQVTGQDQNSTFRWYSLDSLSGNPVITQVFESDSGNLDANPVRLQFTNSGQDTLYFLVSQVNNINVNGSVFQGCETEVADQSLLTVYIYDIPERPLTTAGIFEFCEDDVVLNDITVTGEGNPGEVFYWYADDGTGEPESTPFFTGPTITSAELGLQNNLGIGEYRFWVSQGQNIDDGVSGFAGCESPLRQITINEVPEAPSPLDQDKFICLGEPVPSFTVTGNVGTVNWYDEDGNSLATGATIDPGNLTHIPQSNGFSNTTGVFTIKATQTTKTDANIGFTGCESDTTEFSLTIHEIPVAPATTAASNVYEICEGDIIPDFVIDNPDLAATTEYTWYDEDGNFLSNGETFNPIAEIDQSNLVPGAPNDFDFEVEITTNINSSENFFGCTSVRTAVRLRINGTPTISFTNITDNNAYCVDEDLVEFSAAGNNANVGAPTYEFSLFQDFSTVGTGLTDNGDGTASIDLDELHLTKATNVVGGNSTLHNIYFRYTDNNGCVNIDSLVDIKLDPDPDIDYEVSGNRPIDNSTEDVIVVCVEPPLDNNTESVEAQFSLQGLLESGAPATSGFFTGDGVSSSIGDGTALFDPNAAREQEFGFTNQDEVLFSASSTYPIEFDYTDFNGCDNIKEQSVIVNPVPQLVAGQDGSIITNRACIADSVDFNVELANMDLADVEFNWTIRGITVSGQTGNNIVIAADDPTFNLTASEVVITVTATNINTGCSYFVSESKQIGLEPDPKFNFRNLTVNNTTEFSFDQQQPQLENDELRLIRFTIYEGNSTDGQVYDSFTRFRGDFLPSEILQNEEVIFDNSGIYTGELFIETTSFCERTEVRSFNVITRDEVPATGAGLIYSFQTGSEGWFTDSVSVDGFEDSRLSTWEVAAPGGADLDFTSPFGNSWVTNADGFYGDPNAEEAENSWVYSPSIDFSSLEKPTLSFDYIKELDPKDGVALQVSIDDGQSWRTLGDFNTITDDSGIDWYNAESISGSPGNFDAPLDEFNFNRVGWTGSSPEFSNWQTAFHKLDYIVESPQGDSLLIPKAQWDNVRFRFALGSRSADIKEDQNGNALEGFAFDNFQIYDRDKVVLLESFSTTLFDKSLEAEAEIRNRLRDLEGVLWVNYFTDLYSDGTSNRDDLFVNNPVGPSARVGYYGIEQVPTSVLSGDVRVNPEDLDRTQSGNLLLGWNTNDLNKKELEPASFEIELTSNDAPETQLDITGNFTAIADLNEGEEVEISFRFIVIEEYMLASSDIGNFEAGDTIFNILRKILPDPGGFVEGRTVTSGDEFSYQVSWNIFNVQNADNLSVIAFVQNEITKEVYQAEILPIVGKSFDPDAITGIEPQKRNSFSLYPNPGDESVHISLDHVIKEDSKWLLFDQTGKIIQSGILPRLRKEIEIVTSEIPNGLYFIQLEQPGEKLNPRRIIIIHD